MSDRPFVVGRPHFGRFTRTPEENARALSEACHALTTGVAADLTEPGAPDLLDATVDLAEALTVAGRTDDAVEAFTAALAIREQLGEPRAASTRAALEALLRCRR